MGHERKDMVCWIVLVGLAQNDMQIVAFVE